MSPFPKSAHFRLRENCERKPVRYDPDYPLVLFVLFSRWSFGVAIVAGILQIRNQYLSLVKVSLALSLTLILGAIFFSIFHLNDRVRFVAMIKNPRSQVSQEVLLAGAFTAAVAIDCSMLYLFELPHMITIVSAGGVIGLGLLTLAATGWAYKFYSHPCWNTNILPVYYLISGFILGISTLFWIGVSFFPHWVVAIYRSVLTVLGGLIALQFLLGVGYVRYVKAGPDRTLGEVLGGKGGRIAPWYFLFAFVFPFVFIVGSAVARGPSVISSTSILVSFMAGTFLERMLFFLIEQPNYMLRTLSEGTS
ncbi:MAG: DmsC/YnfH family molybdoenzyme membrane anchor subunit [bacterium]